MNAPKENNKAAQPKVSSFFWSLIVIIFLLSALCIYKSTSKNYSIFNRTWGFDHILFYGTGARFLFFFVCLILILPYSNNLIRIGLSWFTDKLSRLGTKKVFLFLLLSIASGFIFYLLNVKYFFLGDFNLRMTQTLKKEFVATEYLTMRLLYAFAILGPKFAHTHEQFFKLYSYLAGSFFVFVSFLIADLTGKTTFQKLLFFFAQLGTALLLVFCGYVEVYATPALFLTVYVYFGVRYLKFKTGFIFVVLSLVLAIASHMLCLAALPSIFVAWYFNNKNKVASISQWPNKKIAAWITLLVAAAIVLAFKVKSGFFLTLSPPASQPKLLTLFDFRHFWELFNGQILANGLSFIFIFVLVVKSTREKKQLFSEHYFLLSISGCFFLLIFMANLQRGSGDWDIMAISAVSLNLITALLTTHLYKNQNEVANYLMIAITGLNSVNAFLWLQVNHTDRSIYKIEKMLVGDPGTYYTARIPGVVQLALLYSNNKLPIESARASLIACNTAPKDEVKSCVLYGLSLRDANKNDEARDFFEDLLRNRTPYSYESYLFLLRYYEKKDDMVKFEYYLNMLYDSFCQMPDTFIANINFRRNALVTLFDLLYKISAPKKNTPRLEQIKRVIAALKIYKLPPEKD